MSVGKNDRRIEEISPHCHVVHPGAERIVSRLFYLQEPQDSLRLPDAEFNRWLQCLIVIDNHS